MSSFQIPTHSLACRGGTPLASLYTSRAYLIDGGRCSFVRDRSSRAFKCRRIIHALASSSDEGSVVFPNSNVRDPYKRLGITREASEEEVQAAHDYLLAQYGGHEKSRVSIEAAYDRILLESLKARQRSKSNLQSILKNKYTQLPPWVRNLLNIYDVPPARDILIRAAFFASLAIWSVLDPTQGGPAFQVAMSIMGCIYFLNGRLRSKWKALLAGGGSFVLGWVLGSVVAPFALAKLYPKSWSIELVTALISYVILWYTCTFFKSPSRA